MVCVFEFAVFLTCLSGRKLVIRALLLSELYSARRREEKDLINQRSLHPFGLDSST